MPLFNKKWDFTPQDFLKYFGQTGVVVMGGGAVYVIFQDGDFLPTAIAFGFALFLFYISSWRKRK